MEDKFIEEMTRSLVEEMKSSGSVGEAGFKNILSIRDYTVQTRDLVIELKEEVEQCRNTILQQQASLDILQTQINKLQVRVYSGLPTT